MPDEAGHLETSLPAGSPQGNQFATELRSAMIPLCNGVIVDATRLCNAISGYFQTQSFDISIAPIGLRGRIPWRTAESSIFTMVAMRLDHTEPHRAAGVTSGALG